MKYIKEYNFFNSKSPIDIDDIKDILLDLEDNGFQVDIKKDHNKSYDPSKGEYVELPNKNVLDNIQIKISKSDRNLWSNIGRPDYDFNTNEIEDYVERIFDYINQKNIDSGLINKEEFPKNLYLEFIIIDITIKKKWYSGIQKKLDKWRQNR